MLTISHSCLLLEINYLSLAANQLGLNISRKKTKTMQLTETPLPKELENENLEEAEEFTYLGSIMSKSNATFKDITNGLQKAKSSFVQVLIKPGGHLTSVKKTKIRFITAMSYQYYCMVQNVGGFPKQTAKDCQVSTLLA